MPTAPLPLHLPAKLLPNPVPPWSRIRFPYRILLAPIHFPAAEAPPARQQSKASCSRANSGSPSASLLFLQKAAAIHVPPQPHHPYIEQPPPRNPVSSPRAELPPRFP